MSKRFSQPGDAMALLAPYDRLSGQGALIGALFGIAMTDVLSGAQGQFATHGVHQIDKATGAWTLGQLLYWDDSAKKVTGTATSNTRIGCAAVIAASGDATGYVRLNGQAAPTGA